MSGQIRSGYTSSNMKLYLRIDKGWTDAHGRDKVTDIRNTLKKRLLERKKSSVVEQGGGGAVAVDEKDSLKEFVKEKIIDPADKLLVQVQVHKELKKFEEIVDRELEAQLVESLWEA